MPKPGAYRAPMFEGAKILGIELPIDLKLAFTNQLMTGVTLRIDLTDNVINSLETVKDKHTDASFYINGLKTKTLIPLLPYPETQKYYAPGELFFKS